MQHKQIEFQYAMLADKIERIKNIIWRTLKTFTILYHVFDATVHDETLWNINITYRQQCAF